MSGPAQGGAGPEPIAVIAVAGRFPGAADIAAFWRNLRGGVESITRFTAGALIALGRDPDEVRHPRFVGAEGVLDGFDRFDAEFFGYSPREAEIMDPQHRVCLETAWAAFDAAGYDPARLDQPVGTYLSSSLSSYLVRNLLPNRRMLDLLGGFPLLIHNDKDFLPTSVSHRLGLTGPSLAVGTACSSSLVAVHLACQGLRGYECDLALAGGVSLQVPQPQGYRYREDGIYSPDGHCRPFGSDARGTVGGSGVGVVLLKRWSDARRDGDHVHALILGSAVNNDGAARAGYTAPGVDGQAAVIAEAQAVAGVSAGDIGYVEAHGTGTQLGDAIEVEALTRAFAQTTARRGYCHLGSVKSNIGHLDAAAGIAGLIKAVLAVEHGVIPASLHCERPNENIAFDTTPFLPTPVTVPWPHSSDDTWPGDAGAAHDSLDSARDARVSPAGAHGAPRHAGVSAFGIGGTNVHVVLRSAPAPAPDAAPARRAWQPVLISAREEAGVGDTARQLRTRLREHPGTPVAAVSATLAGRRAHPIRAAVVGRDAAGVADALLDVTAGTPAVPGRPPVFAFHGQGVPYAETAGRLYRDEPEFRARLDALFPAVGTAMGTATGTALIPAASTAMGAATGVALTPAVGTVTGAALGVPGVAFDQPAIFAVQCALAQTLIGWGVRPAAVLGHSLGEYAAAVTAGVLSPADALHLCTVRGRLLAGLPLGAMLAVPLPPSALPGLEPYGLALAAVNAPEQSVVSGPVEAVRRFADTLAAGGVTARELASERAFHSAALDGVLDEFRAEVAGVALHEPSIPVGSCLHGRWAEPGELTDPEYWVRQLRHTVLFSGALRHALSLPSPVLVEVGAGETLTRLARRHPGFGDSCLALPTATGAEPAKALVDAVATLWVAGVDVDWQAFHGPRQRRAPAPSYPFRGPRHWVDAPSTRADGAVASGTGPPPGPTSAVDAPALPAMLDALSERIEPSGETPGGREALDRLCASLAMRYLRGAGVRQRPGARHTVPELRGRLGLLPQFTRFLDYLLLVLAEDGVLRRDGDEVVILDVDPLPDPERAAAAVPSDQRGLVELLTHCAAHYPTALSTPGAALGVLYPDGRGELLQRTLGQQPAGAGDTAAMMPAVAELARRLHDSPARGGGPLRILEVGTGGGRLTWELIEGLRGRSHSYTATDIGPIFLTHLAEEAARRGVALRTASLDISRDATAQGFTPGSFDLVVGLDVVHATPDVTASLRNLVALLAPGGCLAIVETTATDRWLSMIWGLSEGWWCFTDARRTATPLLDRDGWLGVAASLDLAAHTVLPDAAAGAALVLGQRAASSAWDGGLPPKQPDIADWCSVPSWRRSVFPAPSATAPAAPALVFSAGPLGDAVAQRLRERGCPSVTVLRPGAAPGEKPACRTAGLVAHLWGAEGLPGGELTVEAAQRAQELGLHSLLDVVRGLDAANGAGERVRLLAVTRGAQDVLGGDLTHAEFATVHSAVKVIPREYERITCHAVDLDPESTDGPDEPGDLGWLAGRLVDELLTEPDAPTVAYRGRHRWLPHYTPAPLPPLPSRKDGAADHPRRGGVYLILGGLGGIGRNLAEHLAADGVTLVLTRRSPLPDRARWDRWLSEHPEDPGDAAAATSRVLRLALKAEAAGATVVLERADVTDAAAMRALVARTVQEHGPITGVVHAAGIADEAGMIQRRGREDTDRAIAAKVVGTLTLAGALRERGQRPDFVVLCSSIGTVLHKLKFGEVGYLAGHDFLNAYAAQCASAAGAPRVIAIGWTDWLEAGMWAQAQRRLAGRYTVDAQNALRPDTDLLRGLTTAEGVEVFRRVLVHRPGPHVVISTQRLDDLLAVHEAYTTSAHSELLSRLSVAGAGRRRTDLSSGYVEPGTPAERAIAEQWTLLLGVEGIGAEDNFFELGGDSLLALRFLSQLREDTGADHPISRFFEAPTIRAVATETQRAREPHEEIVL